MTSGALSPTASDEGSSALLWDVVEEHLSEAAFCLEHLEQALDASHISFPELGPGVELRFLAHIDGLLVGGTEAAQAFLTPTLAEPDPSEPGLIAAAAFALAAGGRYQDLSPAFLHHDILVRQAALRGAALAADTNLDRYARSCLATSELPEQRLAGLELLAATPEDAGLASAAIRSAFPALAASGIRLARRAGSRSLLPLVEEHLGASDPALQGESWLTALLWGSCRAASSCASLALGAAVHSLAVALHAAFSGAAALDDVVNLLDRDSHRRAALFALGFSGSPRAIAPLVAWLSSPEPIEAKLALQSLSTLVGFDVLDDSFTLPPRTPPETTEELPALEDEHDDLVPAPEDALPFPRVDAIVRYCASTSSAADRTILAGRPFSVEVALDYLLIAPGRLRHVVALLAARAGCQPPIDTRALSTAQTAQIARARVRR